jgi:hypothetical protein
MSARRYVRVDMKKLAESQFSAKELAALATGKDEALWAVDWSTSLVEGLERNHSFETLMMQFIEANYKE